MEIRFAPGNLVSNLDFVESIFGNAGDPFLQKLPLIQCIGVVTQVVLFLRLI